MVLVCVSSQSRSRQRSDLKTPRIGRSPSSKTVLIGRAMDTPGNGVMSDQSECSGTIKLLIILIIIIANNSLEDCLKYTFGLALSSLFFLCLSFSLSLCLSLSLSLSLSFCRSLSLSLSISLSLCLSLSRSLSVFLSPCLSLSACVCCVY